MKSSDNTIPLTAKRKAPEQVLASLVPLFTGTIWTLFFLCVAAFVYVNIYPYDKPNNVYVKIDNLTLVMWITVTFFSGIIHSFSKKYMKGFNRYGTFIFNCFAFTLTVMVFLMANHVALFIISWLIMGVIMAALIGSVKKWQEAKAAAYLSRKYFISSTILLTAGLLVLANATNAFTLSEMLSGVPAISEQAAFFSGTLILFAALIQSSIFPFHKWLLSAMTAPTPASALMHAGFVNVAGILLTRFAPLYHIYNLLGAIVIIGGLAAILGELWKLIQTNVKRKLACSTIAQMGFMVMQCGLGFFSAAITHLILHGFFKAYLFLSSGSTIKKSTPEATTQSTPNILYSFMYLTSGIIGGGLFAILTGKGAELNSGLILTIVVALSVIQATQGIVLKSTLSFPAKLVIIPTIILPVMVLYAVIYQGITQALGTLPYTHVATGLSVAHYVTLGLFLITYLTLQLGWHKKSAFLYVTFLNWSQPSSKTVLSYKK